MAYSESICYKDVKFSTYNSKVVKIFRLIFQVFMDVSKKNMMNLLWNPNFWKLLSLVYLVVFTRTYIALALYVPWAV